MSIVYTKEKRFTREQTAALFQSVGWESGNYPGRLYRALMASSTVLTAWDGEELVGLARALDDTALTAYMHYVLVRPDHQGTGIAGELVRRMRETYRDYLHFEIMPEESRNAPFYERFGFHRMPDAVPMEIANHDLQDKA